MANVTVYLVRIINITFEMLITINCSYNANTYRYTVEGAWCKWHLVAFRACDHVCVYVRPTIFHYGHKWPLWVMCLAHIVHSYWKIFVFGQLCVLQIQYCIHSIRLIFKYIQHKVSILPLVTIRWAVRHQAYEYLTYYSSLVHIITHIYSQ